MTALPRLGSRQWAMLDKICRTSGGGIYVPGGGPEHKLIMRLHELGLVQGKAGQQYRAVHTREGLDIWRQWQSAKVGEPA